MKLALAVGCLGIVAVFVWVLAGLLRELMGPVLTKFQDHRAAAQPVHKEQNLVVIPIDSQRSKLLRNTGERIAMLRRSG